MNKEKTMTDLTHYRVQGSLEPEGLLIKAEKYRVVKETPKGYWVVGPYAPTWLTVEELRKRKFAKWVSKNSGKRLCYPDITSAVRSFLLRKKRQVSMLKLQLEQAETALEKAELYEKATAEELLKGVNIGPIPSHDDINWGDC
jgi:hypothetical protein